MFGGVIADQNRQVKIVAQFIVLKLRAIAINQHMVALICLPKGQRAAFDDRNNQGVGQLAFNSSRADP